MFKQSNVQMLRLIKCLFNRSFPASSKSKSEKLRTLPGFTFLIDDQRRVDGEIRTYPEEFSFDDIVKINVGGIIYETRRSTLKYVILTFGWIIDQTQ